MPFDQEFYVASPRSEPHVSDDEVLRCLVDGRARIENPVHWTRWTIRNEAKDGTISRCALGAVCDLPGGGPAMVALEKALPVGFSSDCGDSVAAFNNTRRHADVLSLFDRAIAARTAELTRLG